MSRSAGDSECFALAGVNANLLLLSRSAPREVQTTIDDPQGFLQRCAANWTAFALIQFLALLRWKKDPIWLVMVAATRFTDIFTDWAYLWFCDDVTMFGRFALFGAGPANFVFGWYFWRAYKNIAGESD